MRASRNDLDLRASSSSQCQGAPRRRVRSQRRRLRSAGSRMALMILCARRFQGSSARIHALCYCERIWNCTVRLFALPAEGNPPVLRTPSGNAPQALWPLRAQESVRLLRFASRRMRITQSTHGQWVMLRLASRAPSREPASAAAAYT